MPGKYSHSLSPLRTSWRKRKPITQERKMSASHALLPCVSPPNHISPKLVSPFFWSVISQDTAGESKIAAHYCILVRSWSEPEPDLYGFLHLQAWVFLLERRTQRISHESLSLLAAFSTRVKRRDAEFGFPRIPDWNFLSGFFLPLFLAVYRRLSSHLSLFGLQLTTTALFMALSLGSTSEKLGW